MTGQLDSVIFDLDGTLWDTCDACAVGWNNVARRHGIEYREMVGDDVRRVAGKTHEECIRLAYPGLDEEQLRVLIDETAEEDNRVIQERGGVLYPGVGEGLERLARRYPLFIVSNCQAGYIETFKRWSGLGGLFRDFECWGNTGRSKAENIWAVMDRNGLGSPIYVGDTEGDRAAARGCGLPFAHVGYGFGKVSEADARLGSFDELVGWLLDGAGMGRGWGRLWLGPAKGAGRGQSPRMPLSAAKPPPDTGLRACFCRFSGQKSSLTQAKTFCWKAAAPSSNLGHRGNLMQALFAALLCLVWVSPVPALAFEAAYECFPVGESGARLQGLRIQGEGEMPNAGTSDAPVTATASLLKIRKMRIRDFKLVGTAAGSAKGPYFELKVDRASGPAIESILISAAASGSDSTVTGVGGKTFTMSCREK